MGVVNSSDRTLEWRADQLWMKVQLFKYKVADTGLPHPFVTRKRKPTSEVPKPEENTKSAGFTVMICGEDSKELLP